jgi:hypothetical protein
MNTNSHIQLLKIYLLTNSMNNIYHSKPHINNINSLLMNISSKRICKSKNYITISNCINFIYIIF